MYCPNPFTRLEIKADGSTYCCCEGWLPQPLGNVFEKDLPQIWHGAAASQIRETIADQSFRFCTACPYLPGPGGPVTSEPPTPLPDCQRVGVLKLDYDQTCNLTCPSCRVTHSKNFVNTKRVEKIHEKVVQSGVLHVTDLLYVTGAGDPFASQLYWKFLKELPPPPNLPRLRVFLHTNGLLFDPKHWDELGPTQDRVTQVGISVDAATSETYAKNRGASWSKLWDNIAFINQLQAEQDRYLQLGLFYTVQANNFRELIPFLRLAWNHKVSWVSVTALRNWGTYTEADYHSRAVHLPEHPDHQDFERVLKHPSLKDPRVVLDRFNPAYTDQEIVCCADALLPRDKKE